MAVLPRTKILGARGLILSRLRQESGVIKLENVPLSSKGFSAVGSGCSEEAFEAFVSEIPCR